MGKRNQNQSKVRDGCQNNGKNERAMKLLRGHFETDQIDIPASTVRMNDIEDELIFG